MAVMQKQYRYNVGDKNWSISSGSDYLIQRDLTAVNIGIQTRPGTIIEVWLQEDSVFSSGQNIIIGVTGIYELDLSSAGTFIKQIKISDIDTTDDSYYVILDILEVSV